MLSIQTTIDALISDFKEITTEFTAHQMQNTAYDANTVRKLTQMSFEAQKKLGLWLMEKTAILTEHFAQFNRAISLRTENVHPDINMIASMNFFGYPFSFTETREELIEKLQEFNVQEPQYSTALEIFDLRTAMFNQVQYMYGTINLNFTINKECNFLCLEGQAIYAYPISDLQHISGNFICKLS